MDNSTRTTSDQRPSAEGNSCSHRRRPAPRGHLDIPIAVYRGNPPVNGARVRIIRAARPADAVRVVEVGEPGPQILRLFQIFFHREHARAGVRLDDVEETARA